MHQALRPVLLLLLAPQLAAVSHTRLSRRAAVASSVLCSSLVVLPRAVASSAVLCSSLLLPRAAEASEFQTAESATASQFEAAEAARASRQRDSFERRRAFELKVSAVQDATTAREFVVASDVQALVEDMAGRAGPAIPCVPIGRGWLPESKGRPALALALAGRAVGRIGRSLWAAVFHVGARAGGLTYHTMSMSANWPRLEAALRSFCSIWRAVRRVGCFPHRRSRWR